ncbi:MAG: leucine--tRNA ligase [Candidatus Taylorbacteria bacterium]|nr:leucine--tRNA ligase [Candidatus Taylorbacteria bacterium]
MKSYDHKRIEKKWQSYWEKKKLNVAKVNSKKKKFYGLIEFPYPSGDGLHVGHIRSNTAMDIIARKRRAEGNEVLYPIGWDAFGLPTENYAIKTGIQPAIVTKKNTDTFRRQLKALGFSFDWSREINTTDPEYYKWTQWIFLKFLEKGLAYKKKMAINWCPKDKTGLANEEVVDGCCERCGTPVEKREKEQWMLAITKYADRLDRDLDPKRVLIGTRNSAKVKMIKACFAGVVGISLITFDDIPPVDDSKLVEGDDFLENAKKKSEFYFKATGIPTISTDHILWIDKWPENKGFMVHLRKHANPSSERATDEEVVVFLKNFLKGVGGESKANFHYGIAYTDENGTFVREEVPANYILQDKVQAKSYWPGYPTEALLKDSKTGVFKADQSDDVRYVRIAMMFKKHFVPRMLGDKTAIDYLEKIRIQQKNWIGKSHGINITYPIDGFKKTVTIFTTRPDTNFGATFIALAPDGAFVKENLEHFPNKKEVSVYIEQVNKRTDIERLAEGRKKTGVFTGLYAVNSLNNRKMPMYVADFVLGGVGTGALVGVPGHDMRDFEFAQEMKLEIVRVVVGPDGDVSPITKKEQVQEDTGTMINSEFLNGTDIHEATKKIMEYMEEKGYGKKITTFKLRDWIFSRQRYWGEPIPVIHCQKCGAVAVPEKDLPVKLPNVKNYLPTDTGESPLAVIENWVNVKCPKCKGPAKRETDTMPNWAGSSWYYLRYADSKNKREFASAKALKYWTPVDWYNGGMEHTTLHLLYSRFWHKFLFDLKLVPTSEPYLKRTSHGLILGEGGAKMSKSVGNVVNPDTLIEQFGADTLRLYEMFMGPFDQHIAWSTESMIGPRRFLEKVWRLFEKTQNVNSKSQKRKRSKITNSKLETLLHKTIKKVGDDIEATRFNTAVSSMMILANEMDKEEEVSIKNYEIFLRLLAPFTPHITDELWHMLSHKKSIHLESWPSFDLLIMTSAFENLIIQINGKVRGRLSVEADISEEEAKAKILMLPEITKWLDGKEIKKIIYVKGRIVNIVL